MSEQPVQPDHFVRFGLTPTFRLDEQQLTARYYALQRRYHPDRSITGSEEGSNVGSEDVSRHVLQQSAAINQAYRTLKDPLQRAEYLISLHQLHQSPSHVEKQTLHDPAFLMEQLTLREALAEITDSPALVEVSSRIMALHTRYYQQLTQALDQAAWEQAADSLDKLKFLVKLQQQVSQLEIALLAS